MTGTMVGTCNGHRDLDDGEAWSVVYGPWALSLLPTCLVLSPGIGFSLPVTATLPCVAREAIYKVTRGHPRNKGSVTQANPLHESYWMCASSLHLSPIVLPQGPPEEK